MERTTTAAVLHTMASLGGNGRKSNYTGILANTPPVLKWNAIATTLLHFSPIWHTSAVDCRHITTIMSHSRRITTIVSHSRCITTIMSHCRRITTIMSHCRSEMKIRPVFLVASNDQSEGDDSNTADTSSQESDTDNDNLQKDQPIRMRYSSGKKLNRANRSK